MKYEMQSLMNKKSTYQVREEVSWKYVETNKLDFGVLPFTTNKPEKNIYAEPIKQSNNVGHNFFLPDQIKYLHAAEFTPVSPAWISSMRKEYLQ